jgi:hypothetical protein
MILSTCCGHIMLNTVKVFISSSNPKSHMSFCQHLVSSVCPLSVNFSHFNLLLWNYMANWNHTLQEWCLEIKSSTKKSSFRFNLPKNMAATSILDSDWLIYKKSSILKLHGQLESIFAGMMLEGHLQKNHFVLILHSWYRQSCFWLANIQKNVFFWNYSASWNQTLYEWCLDGLLQKFLNLFWSNKNMLKLGILISDWPIYMYKKYVSSRFLCATYQKRRSNKRYN